MRDMMERLKTIREEQEDEEEDDSDPEYDEDKVTPPQQAILFDDSSAMDDILKEAHSIRKELSSLQLEVNRLSAANERFGTSTRRLTLIKKDSDSIARGIQQRGEALYRRLQDLGQESSRLEEKEGHHSAVSRIARAQHDTLTRAFHAAMRDYSEAEELQKSMCRRRIQRQASIMGGEVTDAQLDELVDKGGEGWAELSQSLQQGGGRSSRWALSEIQGRHKELVELEARLREVHQLFLDMAMLVEEQGHMVNNIESNVCNTQEYVEKVNVHIKKALQYKRKNPFYQFCPCLPCCRENTSF